MGKRITGLAVGVAVAMATGMLSHRPSKVDDSITPEDRARAKEPARDVKAECDDPRVLDCGEVTIVIPARKQRKVKS